MRPTTTPELRSASCASHRLNYVKSGKPEQASFIVTAELMNKDEPPLATPQAHVILKYVRFTLKWPTCR